MGKECRNCIFTATFLNKKQVKNNPFFGKKIGAKTVCEVIERWAPLTLCALIEISERRKNA
jgi:hypothetical protein